MGNANFTKTTTSTDCATILTTCTTRVLQNFLLIWLDSNFDESNTDFKRSLKELRRIVASITIFTDDKECINFLREIKTEKVFMIVSGSLGQKILPEIDSWPQLESVYVFCNNQQLHEQWAHKICKVKGVHTQIEPICKTLKVDCQNCDRNTISISFKGIDPSFMYTQLLKETISEIEDNDTKSIKALVDFCRSQGNIDSGEINKMLQEYRSHTPIWWYTSPYFLYSMLNRGLRLMDVDIIIKMGFFIRHLQQHIDKLYREQQQSSKKKAQGKFTVFRGQGLSTEQFEKMKQTKGSLMSFNNFLSTSLNRQISLDGFARPAAHSNPNLVGILFVMTIDPLLCEASSISFVDVGKVGFYKDGEAEILFTTHTIFRINNIRQIPDGNTDRLWEIDLTLTGNGDSELTKLTKQFRIEFAWTKGWSRLGDILIKMGEYEKAEQLCKALLNDTTCIKEQANYHHQLGKAYYKMGHYSEALLHYEKHKEIKQQGLPPNHPDLADPYNNIGSVYFSMGDYKKALLSYEHALEVRKAALRPDDLNLAASYNNIGLVYYNMGEYSKTLSSYEKALEIQKKFLTPTHPDLASCYNNIGNVYKGMGEYSRALSSHQQALKIRKIALPSNHPDLAKSYMNIGNVYTELGEYYQAIASHEQALEIQTKSLSSNHPDLAISYNNLGSVWEKLNEFEKALSFYQKAQEILQTSLPPTSTHPHITMTKNNIERIKRKL